MRGKAVSGLFVVIAYTVFGWPTARAQDVIGVNAANALTCPLAGGTEAFPGARFRRSGEQAYFRCWYVLGRDAAPAGVAWIPGTVKNNVFMVGNPNVGGGGECTRPANRSYSLGAAVVFGSSTYRCSVVVNQDLRPTGVRWVEVENKGGNDFVIKGLPD
jgi:hypothetical protein